MLWLIDRQINFTKIFILIKTTQTLYLLSGFKHVNQFRFLLFMRLIPNIKSSIKIPLIIIISSTNASANPVILSLLTMR